jgi:riboflavin kinase / FMN adenylyltransferase
MRVVPWEDLVELGRAAPPGGIAAAVGVFDGLHIGHRDLVGRVVGRQGSLSAVVTFRDSPKRMLSTGAFGGDLSTLAQRLELIEGAGADFCVLIDFSGDFSKLPGRRFLASLADDGRMRRLVVGSNFRCGHGLDTGADEIRSFCAERGVDLELIGAVAWRGHPVSSSGVRKAVLDGRLEDARAMLGRPFEVDLRPGSAGQVSPPPGLYDAVLARGRGGPAEPPSVATRARLDPEGHWSVDGRRVGGDEALGIGLLSLVSRE